MREDKCCSVQEWICAEAFISGAPVTGVSPTWPQKQSRASNEGRNTIVVMATEVNYLTHTTKIPSPSLANSTCQHYWLPIFVLPSIAHWTDLNGRYGGEMLWGHSQGGIFKRRQPRCIMGRRGGDAGMARALQPDWRQIAGHRERETDPMATLHVQHPGTGFTNSLGAYNWNLVKTDFIITFILAFKLGHKFANVATAPCSKCSPILLSFCM